MIKQRKYSKVFDMVKEELDAIKKIKDDSLSIRKYNKIRYSEHNPMIKNNQEYKKALRRLEQHNEFIQKQKEELKNRNLSKEKIKRALDPILSFHQQLVEEVETYERSREDKLKE